MTITAHTGTPGSGKSLWTIRKIYQVLKYQKRPVIANFAVSDAMPNKELFTFIDNANLNPEDLIEFSRQYFADHRFAENEILLVLDECSLLLNSRDWQDKRRMSWLKFFSQHRHLGFQIFILCQDTLMIDRQLRSLIEIEAVHRRSNNFGWRGRLLTCVFFGEVFLCSYRNFGMKQIISTEIFRKSKKYFEMYDSYSLFDLA